MTPSREGVPYTYVILTSVTLSRFVLGILSGLPQGSWFVEAGQVLSALFFTSLLFSCLRCNNQVCERTLSCWRLSPPGIYEETVLIEKPKILRVRSCRCCAFGCMVAIRGGYRMARCWYYSKRSPSSALLLYFFLHVLCVIVPFFFVVFCFVLFLFCFHALVGALYYWRCSSDIFLPSRPRTGLATTYITGYG